MPFAPSFMLPVLALLAASAQASVATVSSDALAVASVASRLSSLLRREAAAGAEGGDGLDDNSEPPGPRPGDSELDSRAPDVLPGAGEGHLHGLLGLGDDGQPMFKPRPYPENTSEEFLKQSHRGFCFNSARSESVSVDRRQADQRSAQCLEAAARYPAAELPTASVVIVFHNEDFATLLRSVHSVLNETPPRLLKEILLVDDASEADPERLTQEQFERLRAPLENYVGKLPKVRLVRLKERRGLMLGRMEGAWRARGEALIFLDSHIEATPGWAEPLLARIHEDKKHVVVPAIDGISADDLSYLPKAGLGVLGFTWSLGQDPLDLPPDDAAPVKSPIMAGGLFAAHRRHFLHLGGYDQGMALYGGEEMEISFRTWMCGGTLELMPCSHVGHIFRSSRHWGGQVYRVPGEVIAKNKLRAAEVWMDDYKDLVKLATMKIDDLGDMESRHSLRKKLECKDFHWYMSNIYPDLHPPPYSKSSPKGSLENPALHACIDSLQSTLIGQSMGAYPCHHTHGSQAVLMDGDGHILHASTKFLGCVGTSSDGHEFRFKKRGEPGTRWTYNSSSRLVRQVDSGKCMAVHAQSARLSPFTLALEDCREGVPQQVWEWNA